MNSAALGRGAAAAGHARTHRATRTSESCAGVREGWVALHGGLVFVRGAAGSADQSNENGTQRVRVRVRR